VALALLSACASTAEVALLAANRQRLRQRADAGEARARRALRLIADPVRVHSTLLVADTLANVGAAAVAVVLFLRWWGPGAAALAAFLVTAALLLLLGEMVPRALGARFADRLAPVLAAPVQVLAVGLAPLVRALALAGRVVVLPLGARVRPNALVTEEEIRLLVERGEAEGVIEQDEREMIHSIFEFGDTVAREVMVPRIDMEAIEDTATVRQAVDRLVATGHSRLPVFHESLDNIVGVLYYKDLLRPLAAGLADAPVRQFMRPAYFIPESKRLDELFREMQRRKVHMAVVVDEYGGTAGLVTLEDLLEEIVGPILDEYDVEEPLVEVVSDREAVVAGRMHLEEVNDLLHLALPVGEVDTIGGFVTSLLGRVPEAGERVAYDGVEIVVERVDGPRVAAVRIRRVPEGAPVARAAGGPEA